MSEAEFDIHQVMAHLPHRYPFLLIDRVLEYTKGETLSAIKNVTISEPWFTGHFPESPVMPGVLMLESMAQAAGILAYITMDAKPDGESLFYLAGFDNAKFKKIVHPGDQMNVKVKFERRKGSIWKVSGEVFVEGGLVCSTDMTCAYKEIKK